MNAAILMRTATVRRWLMLVFIIAIPLAFYPPGYRPFPVIKFGILIVTVSAAIGLRIAEYILGARDLSQLKRLAVPMAAVAVPLTIAWLAGPYRGYSFIGEYGRFQGLLSYLLFVAAGALLYETFRNEPWVPAKALAAVGGIAGAYALAQKAGIDPVDWAKYGSGSTLGNPNFVGGYLGLTLAPALHLWTTERKGKGLWAVASLATVGGIVVAGSFGGFAAGAAGAAVVLAHRFGRSNLQKVAGAFIVAALGLAAAGLVVATIVDLPVPVPDRQAVEIRGQWWEAAAAMGTAYPLAGRGPNAFALEGRQHRVEADALRRGYSFPEDPHSVLLTYVSSAGLLGLAGFGLLAAWIIWCGRAIYRGRGDPVAVAYFGALAAYLVQSIGSIDELPLRSGLWVALAGVGCSLDFIAADRKVKGKRKRGRGRRESIPLGAGAIAVAGTLVLALPAAIYSGRLFRGDVLISDGSAFSRAGLFDEALADLQAARDLTGHYQASSLYGALLSHIAQTENTPSVGDELDAAFAFLEDLPDVPAMADYARGLAGLGRFDEALALIDRAARLDPKNPEVFVDQANIMIAAGRPEEAVALLEPLAARGEELLYQQDEVEEALAAAREAIAGGS